MMDADLNHLFDGISRLPNQEPLSEAMIRMLSEMQVNLRMAEHQRLMAEERLAGANARAIAADESAVRERMAREEVEKQLAMARTQAAEVFDSLASERGRRMDAEAELIALRGENLRMNKAAEESDDAKESKALADIMNAVSQLQRQLLAMSGPQQAPNYEFEIQRDGANVARKIIGEGGILNRDQLLSRYEALGNKLSKTGELSPAEYAEIDALSEQSVRLVQGKPVKAQPKPEPAKPIQTATILPFRWEPPAPKPQQKWAPPRQEPPRPDAARQPKPDTEAIVSSLRREIASLRQPAEAKPAKAPKYKLVVHRSADDLIRTISVEPLE